MKVGPFCYLEYILMHPVLSHIYPELGYLRETTEYSLDNFDMSFQKESNLNIYIHEYCW